MSDEEGGTLNAEPEDSSLSGPNLGDLKPTLELAPAQKTASEEGKQKETPQDDASKTRGQDEKKAGEDDRFDQHPRFQELIKDRNELRETVAELRGMVQTLQGQVTGQVGGSQGGEKEEDLSFQDLSQLDDDGLVTLISEKPREFLGNLTRQLLAELGDRVEQRVLGAIDSKTTKQTEEQKIAETYREFEEKNPEFGKMWDSGDIKKFMDAHPGHNAISAYHALKSTSQESDIQKRIDEAVEKALKGQKSAASSDLKARHGAQVLGAGPAVASTTSTIPPELKDPKKFGGSIRVLAQRSAARLAQRGG
jgi:hypothetical protein